MLQRSSQKSDVGKWEIPGGKFEEDETSSECIACELYEETNIKRDFFQKAGVLYIRRPEVDFTLHLFAVEMPKTPDCHLISASKFF